MKSNLLKNREILNYQDRLRYRARVGKFYIERKSIGSGKFYFYSIGWISNKELEQINNYANIKLFATKKDAVRRILKLYEKKK